MLCRSCALRQSPGLQSLERRLRAVEQKTLKRDSLSKQVSEKLEKMIEAGEYPVGERIPTEPELMRLFQVSRNTVREAVQSLTWGGILDVKQGDGTYVRSRSRFGASMNRKYSQASPENIKEARYCIEIAIVRFAAQRRTEEDMERIGRAFYRRREQKTDIKENARGDMEFHVAVAEACHNAILTDLYLSMYDYLESHIEKKSMNTDFDSAEADAQHERLFRAIADGDPDKAEAAVKDILSC